MDNKATKRRVSDHMEYDWFKYIILTIVVAIAVGFIFSTINSNKADEEISIFVSSYGSKTNSYSDDMLESYKNEEYDTVIYGDNIIRSIMLDLATMDSENYIQLFQTRGMNSSDALILRKDVATGSGQAFLPLENVLPLMGIGIDEFELLRYDASLEDDDKWNSQTGTIYGIRIDNNDNPKALKKIDDLAYFKIEPANPATTTEEEVKIPTEFYFCISYNSENLGGFVKKSKDENKQALFAFKKFFDYYR